MNSIVINRKLKQKEILEIKNFLNNDNYTLYTSIDLPEQLQSFTAKNYKIDDEEKNKINHQVLDKVIAFGDKKINDKSIYEWLRYEYASIWHYSKFRIYFLVCNLEYEISEINYFSKKYEKTIYFSSNSYLKIYKEIPDNVIVRINIQKSKINYKSVFNYSLLLFLRFFIGLFKNHIIKNKKHIIIDGTVKQPLINLKTLKTEKDNYFLGYLLEKINNSFFIINEVKMPKFNDRFVFKLQSEYFINKKGNRKRIFGESIIIKAVFYPSIYKEIKQVSKQLKFFYEKTKFANLSPIENIIINYIKSLHKSNIYFIYKYLAYKRFFSNHSFITITSVDENSAPTKTILDAAKSNSIKTIGIQHGAFINHIAYLYTKNDKLNNVMSDYTLVWGKLWKDRLIKECNYPKNSVTVVGQLRTDIIPRLNEVNKINVHDIIDKNKKIIIYASKPQKELREKFAFDVFNAVKDNHKILLIIKPHPSEKDSFDYYNSIATKTNCKNYKIVYSIDLYLLISVCDMLIIYFSTVGSETVFFYKPLIILDYLKQDLQGYHKDGVAFQSTNSTELKNCINKILSNDLKINKSAYDKFIDKNAYKIDGKVSERCFNFINNLE